METTLKTTSDRIQVGRNIEHNEDFTRFSVVFCWPLETTVRRWTFDSHRKAKLKFNKLKKDGEWFRIEEDVTI